MDDCKTKMAAKMMYSIWIAAIVIGLVLWHFARVVYTHWKNFEADSQRSANQDAEDEKED